MGKAITRPAGYEQDYFAWTRRQADLLRNRRVQEADLDNIAEELEGLSRSELRALQSSLKLIVLHLLKLQHQPSRVTRSWLDTIHRERSNVEEALEEMPSLRTHLPELFAKAHAAGRRLAIKETGLPASFFPDTVEFTTEQVVGDFFPAGSVSTTLIVGEVLTGPTPTAGKGRAGNDEK